MQFINIKGIGEETTSHSASCLASPECSDELLSEARRYDLLGINVSAITYADVVQIVIEAARRHRPTIVDFAPVSVIVEAVRNPTFRSRLNSFDLVCPDGQPVRWSLNRLHNTNLPDAVCGTTTTIRLCEKAAQEKIGIYLYGSTPETLLKLEAKLLSRFPDLHIVGAESPPFSALSLEEQNAAACRINESGAGLVFVGLGSPKQENFVWTMKPRIRAVQLCVGAAFDFISGTKKRAPEWMQRAGLEWLHRVYKEPVRLGKRYLLGNARFLALLVPRLLRLPVRGLVQGRTGPKNVDLVVKKGLCIGCGVCAYSDAIGRTVYSERHGQSIPVLTPTTKYDRLAFDVCPGKGYNIIEDSKNLYGAESYDLELGYCHSHYAAHSNDEDILRNASSGGVMSQIATFLLERRMVDRVLTAQFVYDSEPRTRCILAQSKADILRSQGSKYCPVDLSETIRDIKANDYRVAIIGTPCQIAGIRNIQRHDPAFSQKIVITIGNFCGGIKSYHNIELLARRQGIPPDQISFFRFRGNGQPGSMLVEARSGRKSEMPYPYYVGLNGLPKHLRCHLCVDATAELADIACGDAWLPRFLDDPHHSWSIIMTRCEAADALIADMIEEGCLTVADITPAEIKASQRENLYSKKVRQRSRHYLYDKLGFSLPAFDGGYWDSPLELWREMKVFSKHKAKLLLENVHLFTIVRQLALRRRKAQRNTVSAPSCGRTR